MANFKLWRLITVINGKMKTFRRKLSVKLFFETPSGDEQLSVVFHCLLGRSETGFSWLMLAFATHELFSTIVIWLAFVQDWCLKINLMLLLYLLLQ